MQLNPRILALLAALILASLGMRAGHDRADSPASEMAAQSNEAENLGCHLGPSPSLCGLEVYPAGDLFIVEPSFG